MKKILSTILIMILILSVTTSINAKENDKKYEYKITTNDKKWKEFDSKAEMIDACSISDTELNKMTTEELLDAVLNYPLIVDIYLFNSYNEGLQVLANESDAYGAFLKREDAANVLIKKIESEISTKAVTSESLDDLTLILLTSDETLKLAVTDEEKLTTLTTYTVTTPNGSAVTVLRRGELLTSSQKTQLNNDVKSAYPQATYVSTSTTNYNCHSYAWYSSSTSNINWMNDPTRYMSDGSYTKVTTALQATRIYYPVGDHSAKIYDAISSSLSSATVKSKWGQGPVMIHTASYGPYSSTGLTGWK